MLSIFLWLLAGCSKTHQPAQEAQPAFSHSLSTLAKPIERFDGVTITVLVPEEQSLASLLEQHATAFEEQSGSHITIVPIRLDALSQHMETDFISKTATFDAALLPAEWMAGFAGAGYLDDLTERVHSDPAVQWEDIVPFVRQYNASYNQHIYAIPFDANMLLLYYRNDIVQKAGIPVPETWEDTIAIARHFQGQDLNGDGRSDYGSCVSKHISTYDIAWAIAASFLQTQGTQQGMFFDPATMQPQIRNESFATALDTFKALTTYGPPDNTSAEEARILFTSGRCVLWIDQSRMGKEMLDPLATKSRYDIRTAILPGSSRVLDPTTGTLSACNASICPFATDGVNYAPFVASGSWVGAINAASQAHVKDAGYAFLSFISQSEQSNLKSGKFSPYRTSQLTNTTMQEGSGIYRNLFSPMALAESLNHPNIALDLRIPQRRRYQEVVFHKALTEFLSGITNRDQAMQRIEDGWERITEQVGREHQRDTYLKTIQIH